MTTINGIIDNVKQVMLGSTLDADAAAGATVLTILDSSDFDGRSGGTVQINGVNYPYIGVDFDNELLTLGTPLTAAAVQDDPVLIWDSVTSAPASEVHANIQSQDEADAQGDAIVARVSLSLVPLLPLGPRDPGNGEVAQCELIDSQWVLTDLPGVTPQIRGELLAPASVQQGALGFPLPGGGSVFVGPTAPTAPANGDLWIYTDPVDPTNNTIYKWDATTSTWNILVVGTDAIAAGSITADLIAANAIVAGKIAVGALDAMSVTAMSVDSATVTGTLTDSKIQNTIMYMDDASDAILIYGVAPGAPTTQTVAGSYTYAVPAGVNAVKVEAIGAGQCGYKGTSILNGGLVTNTGGKGGQGGEYARENNYVVTPSTNIPYTVGAGGTGGNGGVGGDTTFDTAGVVAHGGGSPSTSANSVHYKGGTGGNGGVNADVPAYVPGSSGGGGGSSAGTTASGHNGANAQGIVAGAGGTAVSGGGAGGTGGNANVNPGTAGVAGSAPGGAGGGGAVGNNQYNGNRTIQNGGNGAAGKIIITPYTVTLVGSISATGGTDPITGATYPAGIQMPPVTVTDWNNATSNGVNYIGFSATNGPRSGSGTYSGFCLVASDTGSKVQYAFRISTANTVQEVWMRMYGSTGGWGSWMQVGGVPTIHTVGAAGEIAYKNGYAAYNTSGYGGARYWKDGDNIVHLQGTVSLVGATGGGSTKPFFTLPAGFRPGESVYQVVAQSSATDNLRILATGDVYRDGTVVGSGTISLTGISFLAEA
jgi:hypothetical protein